MVGNSGSGKSTVARRIGAALGSPVLELDSVFHQPGWQELPEDEFRAQVETFAEQDRWVVDGNYTVVRVPVLWPRATTVVWLDLPQRTVMRQVVLRSLRRVIGRQELWNGNRETWRNLLSWDPQRSIVRWSWTNHAHNREKCASAGTDPRWRHLRVVRLRSRPEIDEFVASLQSDR